MNEKIFPYVILQHKVQMIESASLILDLRGKLAQLISQPGLLIFEIGCIVCFVYFCKKNIISKTVSFSHLAAFFTLNKNNYQL